MCYLWNNKLRITSSKVCITSSTYTKYGLLVICLFPCTTRFFFQIILLTFKLVWWAQMELNHRPHAYQACALTIWAMSPYILEFNNGAPTSSFHSFVFNVLFKVHWKINKVFMSRASLWQLNVTLFVIYKTFILYIINNERVGFPIEEVCTSPTFRLTFSCSLERRWSSRTFWYGYLVTTSPQSLVLPSTAASIS